MTQRGKKIIKKLKEVEIISEIKVGGVEIDFSEKFSHTLHYIRSVMSVSRYRGIMDDRGEEQNDTY